MNPLITNIIIALLIIAIICIVVLIVIITSKAEKLNLLEAALIKLKRSFNNLDEQAKLIIRTDLELNKTQEELDKRLNGLDALQKTSRLISTTLQEKEIFERLKQSITTDLDFENSFIFAYDSTNIFTERINKKFTDETIAEILSTLNKDQETIKDLSSGKTLSSSQLFETRRTLFSKIFGVEHFIISPIITKSGLVGIIFVGNPSNSSGITEGDEELITILANQIGQSLENARLFGETLKASQVLESKVQDRTRQLEQAFKEVQNISKMKTEFISAVSHELRTPLTSIKGYAAILMAGKLGEIPDPVKERLGKINTHSDNLVKLINDLLDISRIESGRVELNFTKNNLYSIIDNVVDILTPQMKSKDIQWTAKIDEDIPEIMIDISQFERVFINLIGNAIKFTPEQGSISLKATLDKNHAIQFEISDTGIGISENDIKNLFEEFFRVENQINQNVKGTGLGLPLAKKIVEAHDGKMWITSIVGEGTTFHFTLPLNRNMQNKNIKL